MQTVMGTRGSNGTAGRISNGRNERLGATARERQTDREGEVGLYWPRSARRLAEAKAGIIYASEYATHEQGRGGKGCGRAATFDSQG